MHTAATTVLTAVGNPCGASCQHPVCACNMCVHYGETIALAPTDFVLGAGTSTALVGANGSGKSTLISTIAGLVEPTDGQIHVVGSVALVPQHRDHHRWMPLSVTEVIQMGVFHRRGLLGRITRADRVLIAEMADYLGVAHLRRRSFGELSGGQQQRVMVARALAAKPDILLLDEPITGLDLPSQARILEVIDTHAADGGTVVFSTHHLAEARRADRVILLSGCVIADGAPEHTLKPDLLAQAFGGRMVADPNSAIVVDDHQLLSPDPNGDLPTALDPAVADLAPHTAFHDHSHSHSRAEGRSTHGGSAG